MTKTEEAVIKAALAWRDEEKGSRSALIKALGEYEGSRCQEQGIGGDPAWPVTFSCNSEKDHKSEYHTDPIYGQWRKRVK